MDSLNNFDLSNFLQQSFRTILDAQSHPGRVCHLESSDPEHAELSAMYAIIQTLCDNDTSLNLHESLKLDSYKQWMTYQVRAKQTESISADFLALPCNILNSLSLQDFNHGTLECPHLSSTLIIEVDALNTTNQNSIELNLSGPGIENHTKVAIDGISNDIWLERIQSRKDFPLGVDLLITYKDKFVAIPRSTILQMEV